MSDLRYPVGKFASLNPLTDELRERCIRDIESAPASLRAAVRGLTDSQLDTLYRPEGWTVRQVVHHLPDSHMNAYVRFKLAITEEEPRIKTYDEARWAELKDGRSADVEISMRLLEALHARWVAFLRNFAPADFNRTLMHPENGRMKLADSLQLYAWHGRHHVAHITSLKERMHWDR